VPKYFNTPEGRMDVGEEMKFTIVDKLRAHFEKDYKVITTDGARIVFPTGWALVRTSNTEPSITYRFESTQSEEDLQRIMGIVRDALAAEGVKANF
jgi:phosphomannomutase